MKRKLTSLTNPQTATTENRVSQLETEVAKYKCQITALTAKCSQLATDRDQVKTQYISAMRAVDILNSKLNQREVFRENQYLTMALARYKHTHSAGMIKRGVQELYDSHNADGKPMNRKTQHEIQELLWQLPDLSNTPDFAAWTRLHPSTRANFIIETNDSLGTSKAVAKQIHDLTQDEVLCNVVKWLPPPHTDNVTMIPPDVTVGTVITVFAHSENRKLNNYLEIFCPVHTDGSAQNRQVVFRLKDLSTWSGKQTPQAVEHAAHQMCSKMQLLWNNCKRVEWKARVILTTKLRVYLHIINSRVAY